MINHSDSIYIAAGCLDPREAAPIIRKEPAKALEAVRKLVNSVNLFNILCSRFFNTSCLQLQKSSQIHKLWTLKAYRRDIHGTRKAKRRRANRINWNSLWIVVLVRSGRVIWVNSNAFLRRTLSNFGLTAKRFYSSVINNKSVLAISDFISSWSQIFYRACLERTSGEIFLASDICYLIAQVQHEN